MQALNERIELRMDQDTLQGVDTWRATEADLPSRSEAIRRLVEKALSKASPSNKDPRFSPGETLIVHMLCDLLKAHKLNKEIDPEFVGAALVGGHYWALGWEMTGVFHNHVDSARAVTEVVDTLDMYDILEINFDRLSAKDKARLKEEAEPFGDDVKFRGFDGNNESEHFSIARFLVEDMGRWSRFKKRDMNSHSPAIDSYRRMLAHVPAHQTHDGRGVDDAAADDRRHERAPTPRF